MLLVLTHKQKHNVDKLNIEKLITNGHSKNNLLPIICYLSHGRPHICNRHNINLTPESSVSCHNKGVPRGFD